MRACGKPPDSWGPFTAKHLSDLPKDLLTDEVSIKISFDLLFN